MNQTASGLTKLIKEKRALLVKIKEQEAELRREEGRLKVLRDAVSNKPKIEKQLSVLESSLAIVEGKEDDVGEHNAEPGALRGPKGIQERSLSDIAEEVLRQAGKPQTANQLLALVTTAKGERVGKKSLTSSIYGWIKSGRRFRLFGSGLIGLVEWKD